MLYWCVSDVLVTGDNSHFAVYTLRTETETPNRASCIRQDLKKFLKSLKLNVWVFSAASLDHTLDFFVTSFPVLFCRFYPHLLSTSCLSFFRPFILLTCVPLAYQPLYIQVCVFPSLSLVLSFVLLDSYPCCCLCSSSLCGLFSFLHMWITSLQICLGSRGFLRLR